MGSYIEGCEFLGSWQDDISTLIYVDTGTSKLNKSKIDLLNKKYEEAQGYGYTGNTIDPYVARECKVSELVAKSFRLNIEKIKAAEIAKEMAKIELAVKKAEDKTKTILKWYHYALIGGGMLTLIALSPTIFNVSRLAGRMKK